MVVSKKEKKKKTRVVATISIGLDWQGFNIGNIENNRAMMQ